MPKTTSNYKWKFVKLYEDQKFMNKLKKTREKIKALENTGILDLTPQQTKAFNDATQRK